MAAGTAGRLASSKPAAATNTTLYNCPIGRTASVVLNVCNQSSTATSYRVALKNYSQILTLTSSSHSFSAGNPVSSYLLDISPGIRTSEFEPGSKYDDDNRKWSLNVLDVYKETATIQVPTKVALAGTIMISSETGGSFESGDTLSDANNAITAAILGRNTSNLYIDLPQLSTSATTVELTAPSSIIAANKYLTWNYILSGTTTALHEIALVSAYTTGSYTVTLTRAQQGSTARLIFPGTTATVLTITATTKTLNEGATLTATDSTITLNNVTGLFVGDFIKIDNEFILINTVDAGTSSVNVTRGQLGSTAATHVDASTVTRVSNDGTVTLNYFADTPTPAAASKSYTVTAGSTDYIFTGDTTGNDPTITVNVGDTLTFAVSTPGNPFRITNAPAPWNVANDVSGVTGQGSISGSVVWDTTGAAAGTYYYMSANNASITGQIILQTPPTTPTVESGLVSARVTTQGATYNYSNEFVYDIGSTGVYTWNQTGLSLNSNRVYRFTQTDTSNTGHPLRFSDASSGTPLYTTGVTTSGTPGSAGSYTQLDLTASQPNVLYSLSTTTDETSYGSSFSIDTDPRYTKIYVYDVTATPTNADTFSSGTTVTTTQTINAVYSAPYGYVRSFSGTSLKISLGYNSPSYATVTTTITGTSGQSTITVGSAAGLIIGMSVSGTGIGTNARIISISGTTITLDVSNSATVSGSGTFNQVFYDTPLQVLGVRSNARVSSFTSIDDADYILYDKALSANAVDKNTGIVLGSGDELLVYSTNNTISYVVDGFEDITTDWSTVQYLFSAN